MERQKLAIPFRRFHRLLAHSAVPSPTLSRLDLRRGRRRDGFWSLTRHTATPWVAGLADGHGHFVQRNHDWIIREGKGKDSRLSLYFADGAGHHNLMVAGSHDLFPTQAIILHPLPGLDNRLGIKGSGFLDRCKKKHRTIV